MTTPSAPTTIERWCETPGCPRTTPLPTGTHGSTCRACRYAKALRRPRLYRGACVCGCGKPAGGRSGMARSCYNRAWRRRQAFRRVLRELTEISLPADALRHALEATLAEAALVRPFPPLDRRRAIRALRGLLAALATGRLGIYRTGVGAALRTTPRWGRQAQARAFKAGEIQVLVAAANLLAVHELNTPVPIVDKSGPRSASLPPTN